MSEIHQVAVVGGRTIGAGWTALFLSRGFQVILVEPLLDHGAVRRAVAGMEGSLLALDAPAAVDLGRLQVVSEIDGRLAHVPFLQECGPERLGVKQEILARLDDQIPADAIVASSTSALLASDLQAGSRHPERVLVGHPFNPPHLLPLVEVVGGRQTAPWAVEQAMSFYRRAGKYPVHVKKEMVGHIANRLTAALFREVVHLVAEGAADVADIDAVVSQGPGLRWALMGPALTYHLAGGSGGIRHYLEHLGPTQELRWQDLGTPRLTPDVQQQFIDGVLAMVAGIPVEELIRQRDQGLVALLKLQAAPDVAS